MKHVVVGTAGHIDHGKSALVRALTGIDPDRLKEEKERGITIDLGFAYLRAADDLSLGFVDVPGHERFVKNMLAGVGGLDLVLLIVAADESVMPQTREHFEICRLLRIPRGIVVITKTDLVDEDLAQLATLEVKELVSGSFLENAPIVPVSSRTGEGLDALRAALSDMAREVPGRPSSGPSRLPIDRVFSMKGFGTVVTGTLVSGVLTQDQEVEILPEGRRARIRGLQVHGEKCDAAAAGQRTAVNLQGVEMAEIERGSALVRRGAFSPTLMLDVAIDVLASSPIVIKDLTRVHLHLGTAQVLARARVVGSERAIKPGASGLAQLRLESPIVAARGDRFILRRYSPLETIAGGRVLDAHPPKHAIRSDATAERLGSLAEAEAEANANADAAKAAAIFVAETGAAGMPGEDLALRLGLEEAELGSLLAKLDSTTVVVSKKPLVLAAAAVLEALRTSVKEELDRFHKKNPLLAGMPKSELRERVAGSAGTEVFEAILAEAASNKRLFVEKDLVSKAGHRIQMNPEESRAKEVLIESYRAAGYRPKSLSEMASEAKLDARLLERVQRVVLKDGTLVQIADGMVFHRDTLARLKDSLREQKGKTDRIDVALFKELFGVTRKHAIPLLEWLDRERVTQRAGNERVIL